MTKKKRAKGRLTDRSPTGANPVVGAAGAAVLLHLHPDTVRKWARLGILPGKKLSRLWFFSTVEIQSKIVQPVQPIQPR